MRSPEESGSSEREGGGGPGLNGDRVSVLQDQELGDGRWGRCPAVWVSLGRLTRAATGTAAKFLSCVFTKIRGDAMVCKGRKERLKRPGSTAMPGRSPRSSCARSGLGLRVSGVTARSVVSFQRPPARCLRADWEALSDGGIGLSPALREQPDPEWEPPGGPYDVLTTPSGRSVPPGEGRERSERGDSAVSGGHGYARTGPPKACRGVLLRAQAGWGARSPPASHPRRERPAELVAPHSCLGLSRPIEKMGPWLTGDWPRMRRDKYSSSAGKVRGAVRTVTGGGGRPRLVLQQAASRSAQSPSPPAGQAHAGHSAAASPLPQTGTACCHRPLGEAQGGPRGHHMVLRLGLRGKALPGGDGVPAAAQTHLPLTPGLSKRCGGGLADAPGEAPRSPWRGGMRTVLP